MASRGAVLLGTLILVIAGCVGSDAKPDANASSSQGPSVVEASGEALEDAGTIEGTVVDEALAPIAAAPVALLDQKLQAATDVNGAFAFKNLAPGKYNVGAAALGFDSQAKSVEVRAGEAAKVQFVLTKVAVSQPYVEFIGPLTWFFDCRVGTPAVTGPCGVVVSTPNDKSSQNFTMTDDVQDFVGEMRWQQGSFATTKALRLSFSYSGRTSSHWFCTATSASPVMWHYHVEEDAKTACKSPTYCGIGASQLPSSEPQKPAPTYKDKPMQLISYTNTPFGCATGGDPTHAVELSLEQKLEAAITIFHGEPMPEGYTAFDDK